MTSSIFPANLFLSIMMCQECCWNPCLSNGRFCLLSTWGSLDKEPEGGGGSILPLKRDFLLQGPAWLKPVPLLWNHSYFPVVSSLFNAKKLDKSLMLFVLLPRLGRFFYSSNLLITMFFKINLAIYKTIT